jgi:hypothetical protein
VSIAKLNLNQNASSDCHVRDHLARQDGQNTVGELLQTSLAGLVIIKAEEADVCQVSAFTSE